MSLDQYAITFPPCESIQSPFLPDAGLPTNTTHKVAFRPYGDYKTATKIIFTVHGLTGDTLNFHYLSEYFVTKGYAVVNVDVMGRGESQNKTSDNTTIPPEAYTYAQYTEDLFNLLVHIRSQNTNPDVKWFWVGVSMGGLLAMLMTEKYPALKEHGIQFNALFFNDISPFIPWGEIERIADYVIVDHPMKTRELATKYYERLYKAHFGPKTDTRFFAHRALYGLTFNEQADAYEVSYDRPGVRHGLTDSSKGNFIEHETLGKCYSFHSAFLLLDAPLLVYRGDLSVLLPQNLLDQMESDYSAKGIDFNKIVWPETGHTPPLYQIDEFEPILEWFEKY